MFCLQHGQLEIRQMIDYSTRYGSGETLHLPFPIRTYFDSGSDEWNDCSPTQKLLDLGYVTTMGYDISQDVFDVLKKHPYISEDEIKHSIALLLSELLGKSINFVEARYESVSIKVMADDIKEYLVMFYVLPFDDTKQYLISPKTETTDNDILIANHWNTVADECQGNEALYSDNKKYIYPGDAIYIDRYNATASKETRFVLNTVPYPFQGNPLTAKVVVLSLNAGYVPRVNCYFAKILKHYPQLAEGVMCFMRDNLRLNVRGFMPNVLYRAEERPNYQDAYNMLGDWYWYDILSKWQNDGLSFEEIFSNVALIQSVPYASVKAKDLPKGCILPSQIFIKKMIMHIANSTDTLFVVPRGVKKWQKLLGLTWTQLNRDDRIIIGKNPLNQSLSKNNLGEEQYYKIINHLKAQ